MARGFWAVLGAVATAAAACGTNSDPCAGLGCATGPGTLVVGVLDAGGTPVAGVTFTESGQSLQAYCESDAGQILTDAGACDAWHLDTLSVGPHSILVSAPGYASQTIDVTIQGPAGCCGRGPEVDKTVTLASSGDAGP
jgi:hypothetical protein